MEGFQKLGRGETWGEKKDVQGQVAIRVQKMRDNLGEQR